jgi:hypothetical protein
VVHAFERADERQCGGLQRCEPFCRSQRRACP